MPQQPPKISKWSKRALTREYGELSRRAFLGHQANGVGRRALGTVGLRRRALSIRVALGAVMSVEGPQKRATGELRAPVLTPGGHSDG